MSSNAEVCRWSLRPFGWWKTHLWSWEERRFDLMAGDLYSFGGEGVKRVRLLANRSGPGA